MLALIDGKSLGDAVLIGCFRVVPARLEFLQQNCVGPVAVDFVGGHVYEWRLGAVLPRCLQQIQRTHRVGLEIQEWYRRRAIMRRLRSSMDDKVGPQFLDKGE